MTDNQLENEMDNEATQEVENEVPDVIGALFNERDLLPAERDQSGSEEKPQATPATPKEQQKPEIPEKGKVESQKTLEPDQEDEPDISVETAQLKKELEKTRKRLLENQSFGRQSSQKLKMASKTVQGLIDSGSLTAEEAHALLQTLQAETSEEDEAFEANAASPLVSLFQIANRELEQIRKYTEDEYLQDKIEAFDYMFSVAAPEEREEIIEKLMDLQDDPVKLTRKMLSLGQEAYESSYRAIKQAGGFKSFILGQKEEVERLQKKIDKLEKKLSQYEDYDKPRYRIAGTSDINEKSSSHDVIGSLFEERDRPRQVAR